MSHCGRIVFGTGLFLLLARNLHAAGPEEYSWDQASLRARGFSFRGFRCLQIRLIPISPGGCVCVAGPASSLQCGEQVSGTGKSQGTHFMFHPEAGREHFCDGAGVPPNCFASQSQQSLLVRLKSAYQGSALGLPA